MNTTDELQRIEAEETERAQTELAAQGTRAEMPPGRAVPVEHPRHVQQHQPRSESERLKSTAEGVQLFGTLCFAGAVIAAAAAALVSESGALAVALGGGLFTLGLWLHLIAQLLHIRAALERK